MTIDRYIIKGNWHLTADKNLTFFNCIVDNWICRNAIFTTGCILVVHGFTWHTFKHNTCKKIWSGSTIDSIRRCLPTAKGFSWALLSTWALTRKRKGMLSKKSVIHFPSFVIWSDAFHLVVFPAAWPTDPYCIWQRRIENSSDALLITSLRAFKLSKPLSF